jgi:tetratricopeptide (TPR) repeat protein
VAEGDEPTGSRREKRRAEAGDEVVAPDADASGQSAAAVEENNRRARRARAAQRRQQKGRPRPGSALEALDASERVDDVLTRGTDRLARWAQDHFNIVQWLVVAAIAGWVGFQIYSWRSGKTAAKVGALLAEAVAADYGRIGAADDDDIKRDSRGDVDARPAFPTDADRIKAATDAYQTVATDRAGTPAAGLAKLGLAGLLYDQGKYDDAKKLYEDVANSDLAKTDGESKGRALEGIGLCLEGKGDLPGAEKAFTAFDNAEVPGFHDLAVYDLARVLHAKGDDDGAKGRLVKVVEKLSKEPTPPGGAPSYLATASRELLQEIDPKAVPPPSSDEALQRALQEFQKKLPPGVKQVGGSPMAPEEP